MKTKTVINNVEVEVEITEEEAKRCGLIEYTELEKYWIEEGKKFITKEYERYVACVPIRLKDLYQGFELDCLRELAEPINNKEYEKAKDILNNQRHSGMSYSLMMVLIETFLINGIDFLEYLK